MGSRDAEPDRERRDLLPREWERDLRLADRDREREPFLLAERERERFWERERDLERLGDLLFLEPPDLDRLGELFLVLRLSDRDLERDRELVRCLGDAEPFFFSRERDFCAILAPALSCSGDLDRERDVIDPL